MLSTRANNVYINYFKGSVEALIEYYEKNGDFLLIRNIGSKANDELVNFVENNFHLTELKKNTHKINLDDINGLNEKEINYINEKFQIDVKEYFTEDYRYLDQSQKDKRLNHQINFTTEKILNLGLENFITSKILGDEEKREKYIFEDKLSLLIDIFYHLFEKKYDERNRLIFFDQVKYWNDKDIVISLDETAKKHNLTRERVRQLKTNFINKFPINFESLIDLKYLIKIDDIIKENIKYVICIDVNNIYCSKISDRKINGLLLAKLLALLSEDFVILGNEVNYHRKERSKINIKFKNIYLVSKDLNDNFDLNSLSIYIENQINKRNSINFSIDLKKLLFKYCKGGELNLINKYFYQVLSIFQNEYNLIIDNEYNIKIKRNTFVRKFEYIQDVLNDLEPHSQGYHVSKIKQAVLNKFNIDFDYELIRSCVINHNDVFISFGRNSSYGLKKWELEANIKGGTIRNIVKEYLESHNKEAHISSITKYVNKFRNTNSDNINTNLRLDESNTFYFKPGGFVGLVDK